MPTYHKPHFKLNGIHMVEAWLTYIETDHSYVISPKSERTTGTQPS